MTDLIGWFRDDYAFLSNFYSVEIEYEGIVYPTVEHAFQAAKRWMSERDVRLRKWLRLGPQSVWGDGSNCDPTGNRSRSA